MFLSVLLLIENPLSEIEAGAFKGLTKISSLLNELPFSLPFHCFWDIHSFSLTKLVSGTFNGLDNLKAFYKFKQISFFIRVFRWTLVENQIRNIEVGAFEGLGELSVLFVLNTFLFSFFFFIFNIVFFFHIIFI